MHRDFADLVFTFQDFFSERVARVVRNEEPGGPRSILFGTLALAIFTVSMLPITLYYGIPFFLGYMYDELRSESTWTYTVIIGLSIALTVLGGGVFLALGLVALAIVDGIKDGQDEIRSL